MDVRLPAVLEQHRTFARRSTATLIILVIAALFARQQFAGEATSDGGQASGGVAPGLLDQTPAVVGQPAPNFELRTVDGKTARLSDFRGKTVVINFWATWCPPCAEEMPEFDAMYRSRLGTGDFVVLSVDYLPLDSEKQAQRFVTDRGLSFPVLLETPDGAVGDRYGVAPRNATRATLPVSFFVDRNGVLREKVFGPVLGGLLQQKITATEAAASR